MGRFYTYERYITRVERKTVYVQNSKEARQESENDFDWELIKEDKVIEEKGYQDTRDI
jgi:hypothetical protein